MSSRISSGSSLKQSVILLFLLSHMRGTPLLGRGRSLADCSSRLTVGTLEGFGKGNLGPRDTVLISMPNKFPFVEGDTDR
jgi:hypothetical protein